jgi:hypothetical protein
MGTMLRRVINNDPRKSLMETLGRPSVVNNDPKKRLMETLGRPSGNPRGRGSMGIQIQLLCPKMAIRVSMS